MPKKKAKLLRWQSGDNWFTFAQRAGITDEYQIAALQRQIKHGVTGRQYRINYAKLEQEAQRGGRAFVASLQGTPEPIAPEPTPAAGVQGIVPTQTMGTLTQPLNLPTSPSGVMMDGRPTSQATPEQIAASQKKAQTPVNTFWGITNYTPAPTNITTTGAPPQTTTAPTKATTTSPYAKRIQQYLASTETKHLPGQQTTLAQAATGIQQQTGKFDANVQYAAQKIAEAAQSGDRGLLPSIITSQMATRMPELWQGQYNSIQEFLSAQGLDYTEVEPGVFVKNEPVTYSVGGKPTNGGYNYYRGNSYSRGRSSGNYYRGGISQGGYGYAPGLVGWRMRW